MQNLISRIVILALLIVVVILLFRSCEMKADNDRLLEQVSSYKLGEKAFQVKRLDDSSTIASQTQTILTQKEAIKLGLLKLEGEIKKVQSQVRVKQTVVIDSVSMAYVPDGFADTTGWIAKFKAGDTSKTICDSLIANSVIVPKSFNTEQKWYRVYGKVKKDGVMMDSLRIENDCSVTVGWKKTGFLNLRKEPIVEVKNTNPFINVPKMNNVVVKPNKGLFQKKGFWLGIGTLVGFLIK